MFRLKDDRHCVPAPSYKFVYWMFYESWRTSALTSTEFRSMIEIYITYFLTHWGRVTLICVGRLTMIGSDNGLSPGRRHVIIWTNAGILLIGTSGTKFSEILIEIWIFSFKKNGFESVVCEMTSILSRPQCVTLRPSLYGQPLQNNDKCIHCNPAI